jgi:hypothetical protein
MKRGFFLFEPGNKLGNKMWRGAMYALFFDSDGKVARVAVL